ncbi:hypothetical protein MT344_04080 [Clavibacter michiganensis subsp. phaseoli]|uniref:hypothetical protein n=1 Tax=Clavibacter phaseoli TaxID=1734031 RepID=UPI001FB51B4D|nr:hypothetical protein [Clavibacter phaseoli]MCJ1710361.1 hypothetical protein [Clavibacter phaseoli]
MTRGTPRGIAAAKKFHAAYSLLAEAGMEEIRCALEAGQVDVVPSMRQALAQTKAQAEHWEEEARIRGWILDGADGFDAEMRARGLSA